MTKTTRLLLIALAVALAAAVPAAYAAVTYQSGRYNGTTEQRNHEGKHRKITFRADYEGGEIRSMKFVESTKCSDGFNSVGTQRGLFGDVDENGDFVIKAVSSSGATHVTVKGHIEGRKAKGTINARSRFNKQNEPDPHGSIKCKSGDIDWSAKLAT
jgi:hypothetical protein